MLTQNEILSRFRKVTGSGNQKQCLCPVHDDKQASLSIKFERDKVLFHCHAGCSTEDVLSAVGLTWEDIGASREKPSCTWRDRMEYEFNRKNGTGWKIYDIYDYSDQNGKYLYSKVRFQKPGEEKQIRYYQIDRKNDDFDYKKGGHEPTLYNLRNFLHGIRQGYMVFYVEGEKDVETLRKCGLYATTAGGVDDWKKEYARFFKGAKLIILPDNDDPGKECALQVRNDVRKYAYWTQVHVLSDIEKGDVTDFLNDDDHDINEVWDIIHSSELDPDVRQYAPWVDAKVIKDRKTGNVIDIKPTINIDRLARTFSDTNAHWICRRYDEEKDLFFLYDYNQGLYKGQNTNGLKSAIKAFIPLGLNKDHILSESAKLTVTDTIRQCKLEEFDTDPKYINLKNGLYVVGETDPDRMLVSHTPDIKTRIQLNADYKKDYKDYYPYSTWKKYIDDLCTDLQGNVDQERVSILQEFAGLVFSNVDMSTVKKMLILSSEEGDSGKSVYLRVLTHILGEGRVSNVKLRTMNADNRFSLGNLMDGTRLIAVGDESKTTIEDSSTLKELTGGDRTKVEKKGRQQEDLTFRGGICICCNGLPTIKDDKGNHMIDRMLIIPCEHTVPKDQRDRNLSLKLYEESDIIFGWAMEGLNRYLKNGRFSDCEAAEEASNEYREDSDTLFRFISENGYIITRKAEDKVRTTVFEKDYELWCAKEGLQSFQVSKRGIKHRMIGYGCKYVERDRLPGYAGYPAYRGIRQALPGETKWRDHTDDDENPFT